MRISVRHIQEAVAADFGITVAEMCGPDRCNRLVRPRHAAMLLARSMTPHSLTVLGRLFNRDHSTVINGVHRATENYLANRSFALRVEARALLLASEPKKSMRTGNIGFLPQKPAVPQTDPQIIPTLPDTRMLVGCEAVAA